MAPALPTSREPAPTESVLRQLRMLFVRRVTLVSPSRREEVFMIDIGLAGAFVEHAEPLPVDQALEIHFPWPGSEIPFSARCRVAWWHPEGGPLSSKSLPPGVGLQFVEMSEADRDRLRTLLVDFYRETPPPMRRFLRHWPEAKRRGDDPTSG
jgi:PilZ domain